LNYRVVVQPLSPEDGGSFLATIPELEGCLSDGETPEEALVHVRDAIEQWLHEAERLGRPIPAPLVEAA
jgi:predicted RNase H-like HicB family nuclease